MWFQEAHEFWPEVLKRWLSLGLLSEFLLPEVNYLLFDKVLI